MSVWEHRPPAEIQMGNGTLLATFDGMGELEQLFAPHIDATQSRLGIFRSAVLIPSRQGTNNGQPTVIPITPENFETRLRVLPGTQVLQAEYQHRHSPIRVMRRIGVHPTDPLMLDSWQISGAEAGLMHQSSPWIGNATSAHCSMFHPTFNGLVHHRGRRWLGVIARGRAEWARVGHLSDADRHRLWDGERLFAPVGSPELGGYPAGAVPVGWDHVVQGPATWGAMATHLAPANGSAIEFMIICAESERHLGEMLRRIQHVETSRYFQMIEGMTARRVAPAADILERIRNPRVRALTERSIDVLHALQDAKTGALVAAAEVDPHSRVSGGYGFSWPRDGAYLASALGAMGFRDRVEHYFKFLTDTQDESGAWWQRYLATGHAGPSWGRIQIDEGATVIGAAYVHFRRTQDLFWLEKVWPTLERGLSFLESFHGPQHPLGLPSHDLWEERMGVHAYSLGAVAAAFYSGAYLAGELSNRKLQTHYHEWGRALSAILAERFVPVDGPIRRSFIATAWDYQNGNGFWDEVPDVSMLGLITPFAIFKKRDVAAQRILQMVRKDLWHRQVGGVMRYIGDHYRGGNPWILTTLWLAIVELSLQNYAEARECFQWVLSKATPQGMLAEQVHRESGKPCWVIPLGWSHAMFLVFVRDVLDRHAEAQIWENV